MKQFLVSTVIMHMFLSSAGYAHDTNVNDVATEVKKYDIVRNENKTRGVHSKKGIRIIDADKDGQISLDEYKAHAEKRFEDMDLDGNNFVTVEEAKEAAEIMRQRQKDARSSLDKRKNNSE